LADRQKITERLELSPCSYPGSGAIGYFDFNGCTYFESYRGSNFTGLCYGIHPVYRKSFLVGDDWHCGAAKWNRWGNYEYGVQHWRIYFSNPDTADCKLYRLGERIACGGTTCDDRSSPLGGNSSKCVESKSDPGGLVNKNVPNNNYLVITTSI